MRVGLVSIIGDRTCDRVTGVWPEVLERLGKSAPIHPGLYNSHSLSYSSGTDFPKTIKKDGSENSSI